MRLLSALSFLVSGVLACAADALPNIVFIISDDHGWSDYGFMGHPSVKTPAIDKLAREGLVFTRGYVPTSLCRPSLASIMTGLYPHQHRITSNDPPGDARSVVGRASMVRVFQKSTPLASMLAAKGYVSLQTGKWWEGQCQCGGFTECMTHGEVARGGRHGDEGLKIGRETMRPIFEFMDRAAQAGKPYFLWYAPFLPHTPHNPPERLLARHVAAGVERNQAKYYAMIEWLDETVGQILERTQRASRPALIAYVADNGWIQTPEGTHFYESRAKLSPYDAGVRTPIILHWPGRIAAHRDERTPASTVDLVPTVLAVTGQHASSPLPGVDLLDDQRRGRRKAIFGSIFVHTAEDVERPEANVKYRWVVQDRWKLIVPHVPNAKLELWPGRSAISWAKPVPELFDIVADPRETRDVAASEPRVVRRLTAALEAWWTPR